MDITVQQLKEKMDSAASFTLIDVREAWEHDEFNVGGELIPLGELMNKIPEIAHKKADEVVVYCRSGNRSGMAQQLLQSAGFSNVRNLIGGMVHWQDVYKK
ncbi:MAG: rhodanese-like domain-containing protein [Bacteroidota bacterium]